MWLQGASKLLHLFLVFSERMKTLLCNDKCEFLSSAEELSQPWVMRSKNSSGKEG